MITTNPAAATTATSTKPTPWVGFGYAPVRGLVDRKIARFLRTQRKNMRRFFQERGHLDLYAQLDSLRKDPTRTFMQKNTTFQRILNEHIARTVPAADAAPSAAAVEASPELAPRALVVPSSGQAGFSPEVLVQPSGDWRDAGGSVPE